MTGSKIVERLKAERPDSVTAVGGHAGQAWVETDRGRVLDLLRFLRDDPELAFDCLMDLTAVDYLNQGAPERYCVVYNLFSFPNNAYFRVKAWVPEEDPVIDSASALWKSAPWAEREVYDLYGIEFEGHPDLKRLMLPEYYTGHPLRKDYPLTGMGERDNFPKHERGA
jgi:NADH/F420H2 dehydrogenase subunit C